MKQLQIAQRRGLIWENEHVFETPATAVTVPGRGEHLYGGALMAQDTERLEVGDERVLLLPCKVCDTPFRPQRRDHVYCSPRCNTAWQNNQRNPFGPGRKRCASCLDVKDFKLDFTPLAKLCRECADLESSGRKRCSRCRDVKEVSEFYTRSNRKLAPICKACSSEKSRSRNAQDHIKQQARARKFRDRYGITPAQYDRLLASQGGACAICREPSEKALHVDHSHRTGKVRALLCFACNSLLGHCQEDIGRLKAAIEYIERYEHEALDPQP